MSEHGEDTITAISGLADDNYTPPVKATAGGGFIAAIQSWLQICNDKHTCSVRTRHQKSPSWLIDTKDKCIVRGTDQPYIALSYTWQDPSSSSPADQEHPFQLDPETLSLLQQPGSLSSSDIKRQLPKVVQDAVELIPLIGDRCLWVDRLCIIQGEQSTKLEVMRMDEIYSGARVTLVAAASHGLYSDRETTALNARLETKPLLQSSETTILLNRHSGDESYCRDIAIKAHYQQVSQSRWATRAWTFQEHILSKRVIFFLDDRVFWECADSVWDMHGLSPRTNTTSGPTIADIGKRLMTTTWPDFSLYIDLVCPYNGRSLTYSGDGLSACSGILSRLTQAFPEGFIYGLPRASLDNALLWQPLRGCYRRVEPGTETGSSLPSWSWCGWQCYVDPRSFLSGISAAHNSTHQPITSSWTTQQCVVWNILTYTGQKVPVAECIEADTLPRLICETQQACFYVADVLRISEILTHQLRTGRFQAFGHPVLTDKPLNEMLPVVVLQNQDGKFSGLLKITGEIKCKQGDMIELIAISKGSASHSDIKGCIEERVFGMSQYHGSERFQASFDENGFWVDNSAGQDSDFYKIECEGDSLPELKDAEGYWGNQEACQFYNVLWVTKKDGISYRVACGRIEEKTWVANQRGETEVVLG
ncbi:hypothetical protein FSARC_13342 [Fusarium sarcochroum]|uniref:Heterokaryon incompatibility domain-containing protein n=1 Tax=Fusarium sarcochroum TaxID=1208366 RepID=A0A8H4WU22_9HYPO|nr:hypothetical protein FSARC_13342 [Fusarium sarcochroum]